MAVIDDVIANIREMFLEEGYDEQLLHELKNVSGFATRVFWGSKLMRD